MPFIPIDWCTPITTESAGLISERLRDGRKCHLRQPLPAVFLRHVEAQQTALAQLGHRLVADPAFSARRASYGIERSAAISARMRSCSPGSGLGKGKTSSS